MFEDYLKKFADKPVKLTATYHCDLGTIKLGFSLDTPEGRKLGYPRTIDFSVLNLMTTKVRIEFLPSDISQEKLAVTIPALEAVELLGGKSPCAETYHKIIGQVYERKNYPLPKPGIPGGGGKSLAAQGQTKKPDAHSHNKHQ